MTLSLSGIYKITNLANNKIYIGQSKNIWLRRKQHFMALREGRHENRAMQADWKNFSRFFRFDLVEYCTLEQLNEKEEYWIKYYNSIKEGYNQGWVPYKRKTKKKEVKQYRKTIRNRGR